MQMKQWLMVSCLALALGACEPLPPDAFSNRGDPESLLSVSSETVKIELSSADSLKDLSASLAKETPTRAVLNCAPGNKLCGNAEHMLNAQKIAVARNAATGSEVTLIYERVVARACDNSYIDDSRDERNMQPPSFGCSLRSNTVQMVTDKQQFVNPGLLDYRDGDKTEQVYQQYMQPPAPPTSGSGMGQSLVSSGVPSQ